MEMSEKRGGSVELGGEDQGQHPCQSRTPVSGHQAAVWLRQSSLPRLEEEHGPADDLVCVVKPVDDARQIDANAGMSAPENEAKGLEGQKSPRNDLQNGVMPDGFTLKITASNNQAMYSNCW